MYNSDSEPTITLSPMLQLAILAAKEAAILLRTEFHRRGGPRGAQGKCPTDTEAEGVIFRMLVGSFPEHRIIAEEHYHNPGAPGTPFTWCVDPNDGTSAYLRGMRGAAISIGLLYQGTPVLGVVLAHTAPDDSGDLFAWAQGCGPLTRNGIAVARTWPDRLTSDHVVVVSHNADKNPAANAELCAPARYRALPSIAYRLALVAAADADAGYSLNGPVAHDLVGGHALLRGAGGVLVDESGQEIVYSVDGHGGGNCFAGGRNYAVQLAKKPWRQFFQKRSEDVTEIVQLSMKDSTVQDDGQLRRAQGCLLGQLIGDALGELVEFQSPSEIRSRYPQGVRELHDGGTWNTLAGQPTDDSEMALALARTLVAKGRYQPHEVLQAYVDWYHSAPFDMGSTTSQGLSSASHAIEEGRDGVTEVKIRGNTKSQANGALMRISPLGIWCANNQDNLQDLARADAALTHPNPICGDASAAFVIALAQAISKGIKGHDLLETTLAIARSEDLDTTVVNALKSAKTTPPVDFMGQQGWVMVALQNAFYQMVNATSFEDGLVDTIRRGGDTDTNGAIAGALLGAVFGRENIPVRWTRRILSCRPLREYGAKKPRPAMYWPTDALSLAERLLAKGHAEGTENDF